MRRAVWIVSALVAVAWTLGALLTAWLSVWADPAWIEAARDGMARLLQSVSDSLPFVGSALGWMTPIVWTIWALGIVVMLTVAGVVHALAGRRRRPPGPLRTV